jgi:porphobilinogen synthase
MVRETRLSPCDLVYPLFLRHGRDLRLPIAAMPGCAQLSVDHALEEAARARDLGIRAVLLFGIPAVKDAMASESFAPEGIIQRAARALAERLPDLVIMADTCLCEYTDHGHCGLLNQGGASRPRPQLPEGYLLNDETLEVLGRIAVSQAEAGAAVVAPSGMLDGAVMAIRKALDAAGHEHAAILSYAVKYASTFYGPFRQAAEGAPAHGDRRSHQMDPANAGEALREADLDCAQGADILMVKPALAYLDMIAALKARHPERPLAAYSVSGEYAMLEAAAARGWIDRREAVLETLTSMRRAGADLIITYHAPDAAAWLAEG